MRKLDTLLVVNRVDTEAEIYTHAQRKDRIQLLVSWYHAAASRWSGEKYVSFKNGPPNWRIVWQESERCIMLIVRKSDSSCTGYTINCTWVHLASVNHNINLTRFSLVGHVFMCESNCYKRLPQWSTINWTTTRQIIGNIICDFSSHCMTFTSGYFLSVNHVIWCYCHQ